MITNLEIGKTYFISLPDNVEITADTTLSIICSKIKYIKNDFNVSTSFCPYSYYLDLGTNVVVLYENDSGSSQSHCLYQKGTKQGGGQCFFTVSGFESSTTMVPEVYQKYITECKPVKLKDNDKYLFPKTSANLVEGIDESITNIIKENTVVPGKSSGEQLYGFTSDKSQGYPLLSKDVSGGFMVADSGYINLGENKYLTSLNLSTTNRTFSSITNAGTITTINNSGTISTLNDSNTINRLNIGDSTQTLSDRGINAIYNYNMIGFASQPGTTGLHNYGYITTLDNQGSISTIDNQGDITTLQNKSQIATVNSAGTIATFNLGAGTSYTDISRGYINSFYLKGYNTNTSYPDSIGTLYNGSSTTAKNAVISSIYNYGTISNLYNNGSINVLRNNNSSSYSDRVITAYQPFYGATSLATQAMTLGKTYSFTGYSSSYGYVIQSSVACSYGYTNSYSSSYYGSGTCSAGTAKNIGTGATYQPTSVSYYTTIILNGSFNSTSTVKIGSTSSSGGTGFYSSFTHTCSKTCKTLMITIKHGSTSYAHIIEVS